MQIVTILFRVFGLFFSFFFYLITSFALHLCDSSSSSSFIDNWESYIMRCDDNNIKNAALYTISYAPNPAQRINIIVFDTILYNIPTFQP